MNHKKDGEKTKLYNIKSEMEQKFMDCIRAEFPQYALPKNCSTDRSTNELRNIKHENKMVELRNLFGLHDFSKRFTNEDFEELRSRARETHGLPAENFGAQTSGYKFYLKGI